MCWWDFVCPPGVSSKLSGLLLPVCYCCWLTEKQSWFVVGPDPFDSVDSAVLYVRVVWLIYR